MPADGTAAERQAPSLALSPLSRVRVGVGGGRMDLTVADNGVGPGESGVSNGRRNMRVRAEELGNTFALDATEPHGTTLTWRVPVG
jgi:signal transduction histidine kinase